MANKFLLISVAVAAGACAYAGLDGSYILPMDDAAIQYTKGAVNDRVSRLDKELGSGSTKLAYEPQYGYLLSVLKELGVRTSSQLLVFSKTSFQAPRISPRMPRAIYFDDDVAVGYVRGGDVLEFAATDPKQGIVFYTLDQEQSTHPRFQRQDVCLQCHANGATLGVPGLVVRSVFPDANGMPVMRAGGYITDHRSPLEQRWGGWYVTGTHGSQHHMGNRTYTSTGDPTEVDGRENMKSLDSLIDSAAWPEPSSDIVALMTLEHQTRMQNLITRVGWEVRMAMTRNDAINRELGAPAGTISESTARLIKTDGEELLKYMLFTDEAKLTAPIVGTSSFAADYAAQGPRDSKGRSLREFDLKTRLFKYRCSPLIYSESYRSLPDAVREHLNRRLWEILSGADKSAAFAGITDEQRTALREILVDTKVLRHSS